MAPDPWVAKLVLLLVFLPPCVILLQEFRQRKELTRVISGFSCEVYENRTLLGYYVASSCNSLPTLRDNLSVPSSRVNCRWDRDRPLKIAYGANRLSRNVGNTTLRRVKTPAARLAEDLHELELPSDYII